jgi:hypothetical protein
MTDAKLPNFSFGTYTKAEPKRRVENIYIHVLTELISATDAWIAQGNKYNTDGQPSFTVDLEADSYKGEIIKIQAGARELGKTARIVNRDLSGVELAGLDEDGEDVLTGLALVTVIVTPKGKGRKRKAVSDAPGAPAEAPAEAAVEEDPAA